MMLPEDDVNLDALDDHLEAVLGLAFKILSGGRMTQADVMKYTRMDLFHDFPFSVFVFISRNEIMTINKLINTCEVKLKLRITVNQEIA